MEKKIRQGNGIKKGEESRKDSVFLPIVMAVMAEVFFCFVDLFSSIQNTFDNEFGHCALNIFFLTKELC